MDLKAGGGSIKAGAAERKPDIVINTDDQLFTDLANGKTTGQKLFMAGKLKVKGQVMLAMKVGVYGWSGGGGGGGGLAF